MREGADILSPPFSSPESRAALNYVRAFVRDTLPPGLLDAKATALAFEPREHVAAGIQAICDEMRAGFDNSASDAFAFACTLAFATLLKDRIAEIEAQGSGRA